MEPPIQRALAYNTYADKSRLGRSLLQYEYLTLDYINHRYAFEQFEKPLLQNLNDFGFTPVIYERQVIAGTVWEGSEAEKKGLSSGSTIIQINDVKFEDMGDCEIEK
ncbi:MAG: hypothetical protein U5K54_26110 [Cytophagales bacterium]|nr:hypothetical protein [Cytophagales bacterium]